MIRMHKVMFVKKSRISMEYHLKRKVGRIGEQLEIGQVRTELGRLSFTLQRPCCVELSQCTHEGATKSENL